MLVFKKMVKQQFAILPIVANDHHGNNQEDHLVYIIVITEQLCFDYQLVGYVFVKLLVEIYVYTLLYGCFPDFDTFMVSDARFVNTFILHTEGSINMDMETEMNIRTGS